MGLYSRHIFPHIVNLGLGGAKLARLRHQTLKEVDGKILEIGFGTGLNLRHYPKRVREIDAVDPNPGMEVNAQKRIAKSNIKVHQHLLTGDTLPFASETFDSVVSTWTLCSIDRVEQALREIYRVLKPQGRFYFLEHGLSPDPKVQAWQKRLTPIQKILADGCHLNRAIDEILDAERFKILQLKKFYYSRYPKILGFFYQGIAEKQTFVSLI